MIQIHMYVEFYIKIHEVLNSLPPNQDLQLRTYSYSFTATRTIHVLSIFFALPIPLPETLPLALNHLSGLNWRIPSSQKKPSLGLQNGWQPPYPLSPLKP